MARRLMLLCLLGLTGASAYMFYAQYFKWRDCFDDTGRCFDAATGVVYLEQSGIAWLGLTGLGLILSVLLLRRADRH